LRLLICQTRQAIVQILRNRDEGFRRRLVSLFAQYLQELRRRLNSPLPTSLADVRPALLHPAQRILRFNALSRK
jgi:hypothetical protein